MMRQVLIIIFLSTATASFAGTKECSRALNNLKNSTRITRQEAPILIKKRYALVRDGGICAIESTSIVLTAMERLNGNKDAKVDYRELIRLTDKASKKFHIDGRKDGLAPWQIKQLLIDDANDRGLKIRVKIVDLDNREDSLPNPFVEGANVAYIFVSHVYSAKKGLPVFKWGHATVAYNYKRKTQSFDFIDPLHPNIKDLKAYLTQSQVYPDAFYHYQILYNKYVDSYPKKPLHFLSKVLIIEFINPK